MKLVPLRYIKTGKTMFVSVYHPPYSVVPPRAAHVSLCTPASPPPRGRRRRLVWTLFALSFVPYFLPEAYQPSVYRDGKTPEEIRRGQHERRLNRILGGNLRSTEFGEDVLDDLPLQ